MKLLSVLFIVLTFLSGCANPGVVQISPDTYMLAKADRAGMFGNPAALKIEVIREANQFASKMGKVAIPLATREVPSGPGRFATVEYQFRVVDQGDPEARRTALVPRADVVVEQNNRSVDLTVVKDERAKSKDVYTELLKLDELKKRKIITNAEFESQKAKILDSN